MIPEPHEMSLWQYIGRMMEKERDWMYVCEVPNNIAIGILAVLLGDYYPPDKVRISRFKRPGEGYIGFDIPTELNGPRPKFPRQYVYIKVSDDFSFQVDIAPGHEAEFNFNHQDLIEYLDFINVKKKPDQW